MNWLFQESKLGLESVLQTLFAVTMLILGIVLILLTTGVVSYSVFGFYGITLFLFGFQMLSIGKTPIGDAGHSPVVFAAGLGISVLGIFLCFTDTIIPVIVPKYLVVAILGVSGIVLLLRMIFSASQLPLWKKSGDPLLMRLAVFCALVYVFDFLLALMLVFEDILPLMLKAGFACVFGALLIAFTAVRQKTLQKYPPPAPAVGMDILSIFIVAVYLILLGILLMLGSSITGSAQLGLMLVIFALQTIAIGSTPIGAFRRTHLVIVVGIGMAVLGIVAIFVPGMLEPVLTILIGVLNMLNAVLFFAKNIPVLVKSTEPMTKLFKQTAAALILMNLLGFAFGLSMLIPGLIPVMVLSVILIFFGCVMLYLVSRFVAAAKESAQ